MRERQEAEAALSALCTRHEQQSRWLDMILKWSQEPIALFDREGRYLLASDSVLERTGQRREDLIDKDLDLLGLPDALREGFRARLDEVVTGREPVTDEGIWPSAAGPRHVEYVLSPMLGAGGRVESVLATVRDITERRQREALLREREEFFRLVFERGPVAVCIISTDGRILRVNARLCEMLGEGGRRAGRARLRRPLGTDSQF